MRAIVLVALVLCAATTSSWSASISLFSELDCTSCNLSVPMGGTARFYVLADAQEHLPSRPTGAEFRIAGLPAGWEVIQIQPNPAANVVLGNPLGGGTNIAFPSSQPASCLLLFTMDIRATSVVANAVLRVLPHTTPSNPNFNCPLLVMDWIFWGALCVNGGEMLLNSATTCAIGTEAATWSGVKSLYE